MTTGTQILNSKDWQEADLAGRRIIFVNKVAKTPAFQNADAETQHAIIERFGIGDHNPADLAEEQSPFSDVTLATEIKAPQAEPSAPAPKSIAQSIQELPLEEQTGLAAGAATGMEAGRREISAVSQAAKRAAEDAKNMTGSPGQKYSAKTGYGKGEGYTVQEVVESYKRAKNKGKVSGKILPGESLNIEEIFNRQKLAEDIAKREKLLKVFSEGSDLLGKVPFGSTLAGAGAGLEGVEAYNAYKHGDYPLAALHGLGALGAGASLIPHPLTRIGGGALSLATIPAIELYQRLRGNKKPEQ